MTKLPALFALLFLTTATPPPEVNSIRARAVEAMISMTTTSSLAVESFWFATEQLRADFELTMRYEGSGRRLALTVANLAGEGDAFQRMVAEGTAELTADIKKSTVEVDGDTATLAYTMTVPERNQSLTIEMVLVQRDDVWLVDAGQTLQPLSSIDESTRDHMRRFAKARAAVTEGYNRGLYTDPLRAERHVFGLVLAAKMSSPKTAEDQSHQSKPRPTRATADDLPPDDEVWRQLTDDYPWCIDVTGDGKAILVAAQQSSDPLVLRDAATGQLIRSYRPEEGVRLEIAAAQLTPDSRFVIAGGVEQDATQARARSDASVRVWNTEHGELLHVLPGPLEATLAIAVSPDSTLVAAAGTRSIYLWRLATGERIATFTFEKLVQQTQALTFMPNGHILVSCVDGQLRLIDLQKGTIIHETEQEGTHTLIVDSRGKLVYSPARNAIVARDPQTLEPVFALPLGDGRSLMCIGHSIDLSPNGRYLAVSTGGLVLNGVGAGFRGLIGTAAIRIFDLNRERRVRFITGFRNGVRDVCFLPDSRLASVSPDGTVRVWDLGLFDTTWREPVARSTYTVTPTYRPPAPPEEAVTGSAGAGTTP